MTDKPDPLVSPHLEAIHPSNLDGLQNVNCHRYYGNFMLLQSHNCRINCNMALGITHSRMNLGHFEE